MMRKIISLFLASIFLLPLLGAPSVLAHGDEPRIEISPERLNPGSVLDIRGVDFEPEEVVELTLVSPQAELSLGSILADVEGIFLLNFALPVDLAEGTYVVRGVTDDHTVDSPPVTVWGSPLIMEGEGELREEDDGLLAPMPTIVPAVPAVQAATTVPAENSSIAENSTIPYSWIVAGIGIVMVSLLLLRLKR